ncbi:fibroblast growth factor receptor 4 [Nematostella vectensis]|uniref:fibroblast growth factor receptor 4 n=1 Tax=Nematostella vectensis TaxID=45351 RepID=UPI002076E5DF|nr:fibroblast growth factor receptor 4 [Nematostella vectensis]
MACLSRGCLLGAFVVTIVCLSPGNCEFKFLSPPRMFYTVGFYSNFPINCTTNDENATTTLLYRQKFMGGYNEKPLQPGKVIKTDDVYTILNFAYQDAGQYQCKATNLDGETIFTDPNACKVFGRPNVIPDVTVDPLYAVQLSQGDSFNFTCSSATHTTLKWTKRPKTGSESDVPSSQTVLIKDTSKNQQRLILMIRNAQPSDTATYKCILTYNGQEHYKLASLIVYKNEKPVITSHSSTTGPVTMQEPSDVEIFCSFQGYPQPKNTWSKDGTEITFGGCIAGQPCETKKYILKTKRKLSTEYISHLTIKGARYPDDHGIYTCSAANSLGVAKADITLNVEVKPILEKRLDVFLQSKNTEGHVNCETSRSNPLGKFKWEYQNKPLICSSDCQPNPWAWLPVIFPTTPAPPVPTNFSSVTIPPKQGASFFRCTATNKFGSTNTTLKFERIEDPGENLVSIKRPAGSKVITIDENKPLVIRCVALTQVAVLGGIRWLRDKVLMDPVTDPRITINRTSLPDTKNTEIKFTMVNTTVNDSGVYSCDALALRPQLNRIVNDSIKVEVLAVTPPIISEMPDQTVKKEKTDIVEVNCKVSGYPKPTVSWYKHSPGETEWRRLSQIPDLVRSNGCTQSRSGYYFYLDSIGSPLVICQPRHELHSGKYKCIATNELGEDQRIASLNVEEGARILKPKSKLLSVALDTNFNQSCQASGNPVPTVQWMRHEKSGDKLLSTGLGSALLVIPKVMTKDLTNYTCTAANYMTDKVVLTIEELDDAIILAQKDALSYSALAGIITGCTLFVLVILIICFVVYRKQKKQIDEYKEFYFLRTGESDYKIDPDRSLLEQCNNLPYDLDWEFPEERLILGKVLGQGAFGQVLRAEAIGMDNFNPRDKSADGLKTRSKMRRSLRGSFRASMRRNKNEYASLRWAKKTTVAVKCLKEGASESDYKDLASELKILIHLGEHKNIVNVLGACTRGRRLMVIIEFAPYGNLLSFLRARREVYQPTWTKTTNDPEKNYTLVDLTMASYQVSRGVEFLASRKCVHRDLAARNVLVGPDYVMKVSDFGLARDIYQDDLYVKNTSGLLPVKWMALESLFDRVYTEKSDVWSFGILLWEIMTLGGTPYPGLPTEQLLDYLSEGQRMAQPQNCPLEIYTIMRDCWMQLPEQRPHFNVLADRLGKVLERNVAKDNPYIQLLIDESTGTTDYYLSPCDANLPNKPRETPDGYEEALPTARAESSLRYDTSLPPLPPPDDPLPPLPDDDIMNSPLPSIPPSYEEAVKPGDYRNGSQSSNESGIDLEEKSGKRPEEQRLLVELPEEHQYVNAGKGKGKGKRRTTETESLV